MTKINLLPWREQKREQEKKIFTTVLATGVIVAGFITFLCNYYANNLINIQLARNQILQDQITLLDNQIKEIKSLKTVRAGLISRMAIVQNLQSTRTLMVHMFDELIKIMPAGIYITKLERKNDVVSMWGFAESNMSISLLMQNIENNDWIQNPILNEIVKVDDKKQPEDNEFRMSFVLKPRKLGFDKNE